MPENSATMFLLATLTEAASIEIELNVYIVLKDKFFAQVFPIMVNKVVKSFNAFSVVPDSAVFETIITVPVVAAVVGTVAVTCDMFTVEFGQMQQFRTFQIEQRSCPNQVLIIDNRRNRHLYEGKQRHTVLALGHNTFPVTTSFDTVSGLTSPEIIADRFTLGNEHTCTSITESENAINHHISCAHDAVVERVTATVHVAELRFRHQ